MNMLWLVRYACGTGQRFISTVFPLLAVVYFSLMLSVPSFQFYQTASLEILAVSSETKSTY